jgi:hypothetical protein
VPDEITVSAPDERVDLDALKRPRLEGKKPSDEVRVLRLLRGVGPFLIFIQSARVDGFVR